MNFLRGHGEEGERDEIVSYQNTNSKCANKSEDDKISWHFLFGSFLIILKVSLNRVAIIFINY
jgi:hypothetical protein